MVFERRCCHTLGWYTSGYRLTSLVFSGFRTLKIFVVCGGGPQWLCLKVLSTSKRFE